MSVPSMILVLASLATVAIGSTIRVIHARAVNDEIANQRKRLIHHLRLEETGMAFSGDVVGSFEIQGRAHGVDVSLKNRTKIVLPGASTQTRICGVVELEAAIPDLLVCSTSDEDAGMGTVPSVPRVLTGDPGFDAAYAIFPVPSTTEVVGDFRTSPATNMLAWAKPEVLRQCRALGLLWLRVRARRCELAVDRMGPLTAYMVLTLAANVARAAVRRPLIDIPPHPAEERLVQNLLPFWQLVALASYAGSHCIFIGLLPWRIADGVWQLLIPAIVGIHVVFLCSIAISFANWARHTPEWRTRFNQCK